MNNIYNGRFQPRAKGQRRDTIELRDLTADGPWAQAQLISNGFKVEILGEFQMPDSGGPSTFVAVIVTTPNGVEFPAYRRRNECFAVCQNFEYKMNKVAK